MLLEPVTTNAAGVLVIVVLWSSLTWMVTYLVMSRKRDDAQYIIDALDSYIHESDKEMEFLVQEASLLKSEVDGKDEYIRFLIRKLDSENAPVVYRIAEDGAVRREDD